jgi:glyoxylase-like metal-dependent hydrolase (beta-lactamase superfamily II)
MWSVYSAEKGFDFNGFAIATDDGVLIVDPPSDDDAVFEAITAIDQPCLVVVTNRDHERASDAFRVHYGIPVAAHHLDASFMAVCPEQTFDEDTWLPGGFRVVHLPHQKSPGESALYQPQQGLLLVGDAVIGHPVGQLAMLPLDKYANPKSAHQALKRLADLHPGGLDTLLTGDGEPVLTHAQDALDLCLLSASL